MSIRTRQTLSSSSVLAVVMALSAAAPAYGAGFYIQEQSVTGLGRAFAGQAADPLDASTVYSNPAGMTELGGPQISLGGHFLVPSLEVENEGTTRSGTAVSGNSSHNYTSALVPNAYAAMPLTEDNRLWVGLGVSAPFGTVTEYEPTWFGRYDSIRSELLTIDVAPSVAYRLSDWLSVGGGIDIQYAKAELSNAVPTGGPDATSEVSGSDISFGVNLGVQMRPWDGTSIGLHYRSQITHDIEGDATVSTILGTTVADAGAELNLPDIVGLGISQQITPDLKILGQVNWFNWSRFEEIRVETPTTTTVREQDYDDTFSVALGAEYSLTDTWTLRAGTQWDETPTVDSRRSTRIPDEDRIWLAFGASYNLNPNVSFDLGYAHVFYKTIEVDVTDTFTAGTIRTRAEFENQPNIFSAALRYRF
ncbi:MAG: OmpP1/FadL family transporter [Pseudomonadota bacterium]|nr:OmpP1/FadL family transporter [Pseudomonadota bacterium]